MRIIHCAPFNIVTKSGGALYSNPIKISHGLIQNGHFVHNFDYRDMARYFSFFRNKKHGQNKMNHFFISNIDDIKPDLIIFGHAELIYPETFAYIKNQGIKILFWYNDIPIQKSFSQVSPFFDVIVTTAGGKFVENLQKFNKNSFFMPNLVDKNIEKHKSFENDHYMYDILFSGRPDQEREKVISTLKVIYNQKLKIIGDTKKTTIIGEKYFELIQDSKICINHNKKFTLENKWYTSDRLMHILANGSFCLSTKIIGGEDFFEDKLEYYNSEEELMEKVKYFLHHDEQRIEKAIWLHKRVHQLFNAKRVSQYLLDLVYQDLNALEKYEWYQND